MLYGFPGSGSVLNQGNGDYRHSKEHLPTTVRIPLCGKFHRFLGPVMLFEVEMFMRVECTTKGFVVVTVNGCFVFFTLVVVFSCFCVKSSGDDVLFPV